MCGIVCAFNTKDDKLLRPKVLEMAKTIRHRGPDWSGIYSNENAIIAHERLAIVDPSSGQQPLFSQDDRYILAANGEIYNHQDLRNQFPDYDFSTKSDCEVILPLYEKYGPDFLDMLNGIFAFALFDKEKTIIINRCSEKIYELIENIIEKKISDIKFILFLSNLILSNVSKMNSFFSLNSKFDKLIKFSIIFK